MNGTDSGTCTNNSSSIQNTISFGLDLYLPPFLFMYGVISNILVIIVMRSKHFRFTSTSFYMMVNAVTDTASILANLPVHYIFINFHLAFRNVIGSQYLCSFFNFFGWATSDLGILFTVAMTTERAIAVRRPLQAFKLCTTRRAAYAVIGLSIFECIKLAHMITESVIIANSTSRLCDIRKDNLLVKFYVEDVWPWFHITILILSYIVAIAGNVVILQSIRNSKSQTSLQDGQRVFRINSGISFRNRQLSLMLVVDSLALVVCTLPFGIVYALIAKFHLLPDSQDGKNLAYTFTFYLLYVNRCLNLPLYCISGQRFREALKNIFCVHTPRHGSLGKKHFFQSSSGRGQHSQKQCNSRDKDSPGDKPDAEIGDVTSILIFTTVRDNVASLIPIGDPDDTVRLNGGCLGDYAKRQQTSGVNGIDIEMWSISKNNNEYNDIS